MHVSKRDLESSSLEKSLDAIWRRGDHDEVSLKHILHAVAALCVGLHWDQGADYKLDGLIDSGLHKQHWDIYGATKSCPDFNSALIEKISSELSRKWKRIQKLRDKVGIVEFERLFKEINYGFNLDWEKSLLTD